MQYTSILVIVSAVFLFLYFFLKPDIDITTSIIIFGIWSVSMIYDIHITFVNEHYIAKHERSFILSFIHKRFSHGTTMLLVMAIESVCVILLPTIIVLEFNLGQSLAVAYFFTLLHILALCSNEDFVRKSKISQNG